MNLKSRAVSPGPSPAGGPVVPGPPIWNLFPPISRLASWLLHTSNTVFKKCAPPSVFWPPLLLNPGDGPGLHPTHLLTRSNELKQIFPTCRLQTTFDKRHWRFIFSPDWQLILCKASYFAEGRLLLTNNVLDTSSYTLRRASINSERLHEEREPLNTEATRECRHERRRDHFAVMLQKSDEPQLDRMIAGCHGSLNFATRVTQIGCVAMDTANVDS